MQSGGLITVNHDEVLRTNALEGYLLNDLTASEREAFESHMFGCSECKAELVFFESLLKALEDDPELGLRFHAPHAAAAYVLEDLSPEKRQEFELHMNTCKACARNAQLGKNLLKQFLDPNTRPVRGTRLLNALRFVRWFRLVFGD